MRPRRGCGTRRARALAALGPLLFSLAGVARAGEDEAALRAEVVAAWPGPAPAEDATLDGVARAVAGDVLAGRVGAEEGRGFTTVQTRLWEAGALDPRPTFAAVISDGVTPAQALIDALAELPDRERQTHLGLALAADGERRAAVAVLVRRELTADEVPDWTPRTTQALGFSLRDGLRDPRVDVLGPGASTLAVRLAPRGDGFEARFELGADPGVYRVEVLARDERGTLALVGLGVGTIPGTVRAPRDPAEQLERWIALERERLGLSALTRLDALDGVALAHSEALRDGRSFGHGPAGQEPVERIRTAGVPFSVALENVGRAGTLDWVHTLVMASPRHRENLLHPRLTHVGLGVVRVEPLTWYVTEDFVRMLQPVDPERAKAEVLAAVAEVRRASALQPLHDKRVLDRLAARWCEHLAGLGATRLEPDQIAALTEDVRFHLDDAGRVVADLLVVDDVAALTWIPELGDPSFDQVGVGLVQAPGGGMITVLLILVARTTGDDNL